MSRNRSYADGVEPARSIQQLGRDGKALIELAVRDLDAKVPCCPGWTVHDVVAHTAEVYQNKLAVLRTLAKERPTEWQREAPDGDVVAWFNASLTELVSVLRSHPAETPVWTWFGPEQTVGFWARRMAQETVIHRADVELAFGPPHHVEAPVANDGIEEVLERFLAYGYDDESYAQGAGSGETVVVRTADYAWHVTLGPDKALVGPGAARADATVAGTPSHVLYWLWGRVPDDAVMISGDPAAAAALRRALVATTQ